MQPEVAQFGGAVQEFDEVMCTVFAVHFFGPPCVTTLCLISAVQMATLSSSGGIVHDKLYACYFCNKLVTNIWRHYESVHDKELLVQKISAVPKTDPRRQKEIVRLRLLGDYHHNLNVLCTKEGKLIVVRRPRSAADHSDFLPCRACKSLTHSKAHGITTCA